MKWKKVTIQVNREYEETVENILVANDFYSYEIENGDIYGDNVTGEFYDELQPDEATDGSKSVISFYREADSDDSDLDGVREALKEALGTGTDPVEITIVDDEEWKDKWKEFFHSFTVDGIHIRPTWEEDNDTDADMDIVIDPGMAFGTGKHESTYMILEHMREYIKPGDSVADIGCGSGILSIAAAGLKAGRICGTDIDADSVDCTYENLRQNGYEVTEKEYAGALKRIDGEFLVGDISSDGELVKRLGSGRYNVVFANILADIVIGMADKLCLLCSPYGVIVTSGIIDFKEQEVIDRFDELGFVPLRRYSMGEWRSVVFKRSAECTQDGVLQQDKEERRSTMNNEEAKKLVDEIKDIVRKGNASKIIITNKDGEVVLNIPVTAGLAGVAVGVFAAKWALIASVIATIGFGCGVEVVKSDGQVIKIK